MASDVANTRKQVIRTLDPVSNLIFDVSFRRLRVAKNRAPGVGPARSQIGANTASNSDTSPSKFPFGFFKRRPAAAGSQSQAMQPGAGETPGSNGNAVGQRFPFFARRRGDTAAASADSQAQEGGSGRPNGFLMFLRSRGPSGMPGSQQEEPDGNENSSANSNYPSRRFPFLNRRGGSNLNQEAGQPESGDAPDSNEAVGQDGPTETGEEEGTPANPRTSVLVVDEAGSIRKLEGPCPQQEFFSVSQSISWQRKIPSRLQVNKPLEFARCDSSMVS